MTVSLQSAVMTGGTSRSDTILKVTLWAEQKTSDLEKESTLGHRSTGCCYLSTLKIHLWLRGCEDGAEWGLLYHSVCLKLTAVRFSSGVSMVKYKCQIMHQWFSGLFLFSHTEINYCLFFFGILSPYPLFCHFSTSNKKSKFKIVGHIHFLYKKIRVGAMEILIFTSSALKDSTNHGVTLF